MVTVFEQDDRFEILEECKMKKKLLLSALALALPLVLLACSDDDNGDDNGGATDNGDELRTVVLYSNAISGGREEWIVEHAAEAGFYVVPVDLSGVDLQNRLQMESVNPQADVVFGLNQIGWMQLVEYGGVLEPFTPEWADEVDADLHSEDGYFHAVALMANLMVYDADQLDGRPAPTDWLDWWENEDFHGAYSINPTLGGSTVQMVLSGLFNRYLDEDGEMGLSAEGWEHIMAKFEHAHIVPQDNPTLAFIDDTNDAFMAQIWHAGIANHENLTELDFSIVVPEVGVPFSVEALALIDGAQNQENAQDFINWFGSAEVMNAFALEFDYLPANENALEGLPEFTLWIADLPMQEIDWVTVSYWMPQWLEHLILNTRVN